MLSNNTREDLKELYIACRWLQSTLLGCLLLQTTRYKKKKRKEKEKKIKIIEKKKIGACGWNPAHVDEPVDRFSRDLPPLSTQVLLSKENNIWISIDTCGKCEFENDNRGRESLWYRVKIITFYLELCFFLVSRLFFFKNLIMLSTFS